MTFDDAVVCLNQWRCERGIRYDLNHFLNVLSEFGDPHRRLPQLIHVAGTNGKGSTVTYLASALRALGFSVGTYTSPHLFSYRERIAWNLEPLSEEVFSIYFSQCYQVAKNAGLTEFELLTLMAFLFFLDKQPDYVLLETGLGGRLDATNVVVPVVTALTSISYDHMEILGNSLTAIAREKAGIIKQGVAVVSVPQQTDVWHVLEQTCIEKGSELIRAVPDQRIPKKALMQGNYQKQNRGLARAVLRRLEAVKELNNYQAIIESGLNHAVIFGRFSVKTNGKQTIVVDSAHNVDAMAQLVETLGHRFPGMRPVFLLGMLKKEGRIQMIKAVSPQTATIYYCDFLPGVSYSIEEIRDAYPALDVRPFVLGKDLLPCDPVLVIAGSIRFIASFQRK